MKDASANLRTGGKLLLLAVPYAVWLAVAIRPRTDAPRGAGRSRMRIVSMTPALTEICFDLGLGGSVAGVTTFCDHPPDAKKKPKIGGYANPDYERIMALDPDLVLVSPGPGNWDSVRVLRKSGARVEVLWTESVADVLSAIERVGEICGVPRSAALVRARIEEGLASVAEKVRGRERPGVILALSPPPRVFLAGGRSFTGELLEIAGGLNPAANAREDFQAYDLEQIASMAPEVIIDASMGGDAGSLDGWRVLRGVPAVETGRTYLLPGDAALRPGPRLAQGALDLARLIHPEAFE